MVVVPEAEAVVAPWRALGELVAPRSVPAHVTVLYPFAMPPLGEALLATVAATVVRRPVFEVTFWRTGVFAERLLYLEPDPSEPFLALTRELTERFPDHPPYAGEVPVELVKPHLTVAFGLAPQPLREALAALGAMAPIIVHTVTHVTVLAEDEHQEWQVVAEAPLGG